VSDPPSVGLTPADYSSSVPASELGFETASWGRRILAYVVDSIASALVVIAAIGPAQYSDSDYSGFLVLGVYILETALFTALVGGSFGKLATRLRVVSTGRPGNVPVLKALLRQFLVVLAIPPLVFRPDGRGLHDIAAGSATVTLQTWQSLART